MEEVYSSWFSQIIYENDIKYFVVIPVNDDEEQHNRPSMGSTFLISYHFINNLFGISYGYRNSFKFKKLFKLGDIIRNKF